MVSHSSDSLLERFPALDAIPNLVHGFVLRSPAIDVDTDRDTALDRLGEFHRETAATALGIPSEKTWLGDQVHGDHLEVCDGKAKAKAPLWPETDGLVTSTPGEFLGIYVADCCAVFLADPARKVCALVHSGKKGTELGIAPQAIALMHERFGSDPADIVVQLSPCIRPPAYEIDFAATIREDCLRAGVPASQVHDPGTCTSRDLERYYSYRTESGRTGRHLALIGWRDS